MMSEVLLKLCQLRIIPRTAVIIINNVLIAICSGYLLFDCLSIISQIFSN